MPSISSSSLLLSSPLVNWCAASRDFRCIPATSPEANESFKCRLNPSRIQLRFIHSSIRSSFSSHPIITGNLCVCVCVWSVVPAFETDLLTVATAAGRWRARRLRPTGGTVAWRCVCVCVCRMTGMGHCHVCEQRHRSTTTDNHC